MRHEVGVRLTVMSIMNVPAGTVVITPARTAVSSRKIPAHSQVAPGRSGAARGGRGPLPERDHFSRQSGHERVRVARRPREQDTPQLRRGQETGINP